MAAAGYQTFYLPDEMTKFLEGNFTYKRSELLRIIVMKAMLNPMSESELEYYDDLVHEMKRKGFDRVAARHTTPEITNTPVTNTTEIKQAAIQQPVKIPDTVEHIPVKKTKKQRPVIVSDNNY